MIAPHGIQIGDKLTVSKVCFDLHSLYKPVGKNGDVDLFILCAESNCGIENRLVHVTKCNAEMNAILCIANHTFSSIPIAPDRII